MWFIPVSPVVDGGEVDSVLEENRADRGQVVLGRHVQGSLAEGKRARFGIALERSSLGTDPKLI